MEIQSAFNAGVQGFQRATEDANKAAADIASRTGVNPIAEQELQAAQPVKAPAKVEETPDLSQSVVELKIAEVQAKASANVIQAADENLGTLIDVRV